MQLRRQDQECSFSLFSACSVVVNEPRRLLGRRSYFDSPAVLRHFIVAMASHHDNPHGHGEGGHYERQGWEGESDDELQCNHEEGVGKVSHDHLSEDPLFEKKQWTLNDWTQFIGKMPGSKSRGKPSPKLVQYVKELLPSEPAKVLLPLCGKTPDLRWLYERGNEVVGIEGVEKLVSEFFEAHDDLTHTVEDCSFGKLYKTPDNRLKVYVCDVTKIPSNTLGPFDAVFDWGAFTAIHEDDRQKYVDVITGMLKPDYRYFVEVCHDGPTEMVSGPSTVSLRDLKLNFGPDKQLRFLETKDIAKEWGVDAFFNSYAIITPSEKK